MFWRSVVSQKQNRLLLNVLFLALFCPVIPKDLVDNNPFHFIRTEKTDIVKIRAQRHCFAHSRTSYVLKATVIQFQIIYPLCRFDTQALYVAFYRFVIYDVSYLTVDTTTKRAFEAVEEWSGWVSDISFLQGLCFVCYVKHGETKPESPAVFSHLNVSGIAFSMNVFKTWNQCWPPL